MYDKITGRLAKTIVIFLTGLVTGTISGAYLMKKDEKEDDGEILASRIVNYVGDEPPTE